MDPAIPAPRIFHTAEVIGSIPVAPTTPDQGESTRGPELERGPCQ